MPSIVEIQTKNIIICTRSLEGWGPLGPARGLQSPTLKMKNYPCTKIAIMAKITKIADIPSIFVEFT